mmetsp:Transcript_39806/g.127541  ORF Transcript_39806/g.127541 Transcript_39806/m.127541 type:complete len:319 (-) Transcript_39806:1359-2315(-)
MGSAPARQHGKRPLTPTACPVPGGGPALPPPRHRWVPLMPLLFDVGGPLRVGEMSDILRVLARVLVLVAIFAMFAVVAPRIHAVSPISDPLLAEQALQISCLPVALVADPSQPRLIRGGVVPLLVLPFPSVDSPAVIRCLLVYRVHDLVARHALQAARRCIQLHPRHRGNNGARRSGGRGCRRRRGRPLDGAGEADGRGRASGGRPCRGAGPVLAQRGPVVAPVKMLRKHRGIQGDVAQRAPVQFGHLLVLTINLDEQFVLVQVRRQHALRHRSLLDALIHITGTAGLLICKPRLFLRICAVAFPAVLGPVVGPPGLL